jgi:hypothetical protein
MNAGVYDSNRANGACAADNPGPAVAWMTAITCLMLACFLVSCGKQADQAPLPNRAEIDAIIRERAMKAANERAAVTNTAAPESVGMLVQPTTGSLGTNDQTSSGEPAVVSLLAAQLKAIQRAKPEPAQKEILTRLKHALALDAPELNVPDIRRAAAVSSARLLSQHDGRLYKFAGLILETGFHEATIVIKNTEVVCAFADAGWKDEGMKPGVHLFACGFFQSYKETGDLKQITMTNCCTLEDFDKLRAPLTAEENQQAVKDWEEAVLYKLHRDLGDPKATRAP